MITATTRRAGLTAIKAFRSLPVLFGILIGTAQPSVAQVSVSDDQAPPDNSAMLEVKTATKGFLPPRMSNAQMNAIAGPAAGLIVYNTDTHSLCMYDGFRWLSLIRNNVTCGNLSIDGKIYQTIIIANRCWMAENLNVGNRINGSVDQANNSTVEKYCYNDQESNCDLYGGLYQWDEMMQYSTIPGTQGLCPGEWHIPTETDWMALINYLGGLTAAGGKLKEEGLSHWTAPNTGATNAGEFSALPAGRRQVTGAFSYLGTTTYLWSSSSDGSVVPYAVKLTYDSGEAVWGTYNKMAGFSVRCIYNYTW